MSDDESAFIRRLDVEGRRKYMASSMVSLMKVTKMDVVLAGSGASSSAIVSKLESEKVALLEKVQKLKMLLRKARKISGCRLMS